ncbi:MAG: ABC transporter permease [Acidimicrobiales bacterium]
MNTSLLAQRVLDGLANGSLYGSLALAITLVYRSSGRVNLAQGELATFGTYLSLVFTTPATPALAGTMTAARWLPGAPWPLWAAIPAAVAFSALVGAGIERYVLRRVPARDGRAAISLTVALLLLINALTTNWFGSGSRAYPSPFPNDVTDQLGVFGARLRYTTIGTWVTLLVVMGLLYLLLLRTRFGLAFRAVSCSGANSELCGIRMGRVLSGSWALAAALGTLVGALAANRLVLTSNMMTRLLVYALVAATIGGLSSPLGALVGGILVGVGQSLLGGYVPRVDNVLAFPLLVLAMVVMLYVRPGGLFSPPGLRASAAAGGVDGFGSGDADGAGAGAAGFRSAGGAPGAGWRSRLGLTGRTRTAADTAADPAAGQASHPATFAHAVAPRWSIPARSPQWRVAKVVLALVALVAMVAPAFVFPYLEARLVAEVIATAVALWGLGFLVGDAGRISLAHATFMGVGAYTTAIVASRYDVHPFVGVLIAGVVGFVVGGALSLPAMRIRGQYLAMVTFALAVIFPSLLNRFKWFTGGELGPAPTDVPQPPSWLPLPESKTFAWLHIVSLAAAVALGWMLQNLRKGAFGRAVRASAQHEAAAAAMGVALTRVRTQTFAASTGLAAIGGAFVAVQTQAVTSARFDVMRSLALYAMVAVFGAGSLLSAVLASLALVGTPWLMTVLDISIGARGVPPDAPGGGAYLLWGLALVAVTVAAPQGLVPLLRRRFASVLQITDDEHPEAFLPARARPDKAAAGPGGRGGRGRRAAAELAAEDPAGGVVLLDVDAPLRQLD